jgi:ubiquinone/menaquinone biosynthesis C-methylase UbiE
MSKISVPKRPELGLREVVQELNGRPASAEKVSAERSHQIKAAVSAVYSAPAALDALDTFWNWGYYDPDLEREIASYIPNFNRYPSDGYSEQLYFLALRRLPIEMKDYGDRSVLEVGCGMGEGLNFLSRIVEPRSMTGLDLSAAAIERAKAKLERGTKLRYVHGDAEKLPFEDESFDVVINVESSHNYPDLGRFIDEVTRVLKPGGYFSYLDITAPAGLGRIDAEVKAPRPLEWLGNREISDGVKESITRRMRPDSAFMEAGRRKYPSPPIIRGMMRTERAAAAGAYFIGRITRAERIARSLGLIPKVVEGGVRMTGGIPVTRYVHHWARKQM